MSLLDNKFVQILLVFLAFYVVMQIMNKDTMAEHLDSKIQTTAPTLPQPKITPAPAFAQTGGLIPVLPNQPVISAPTPAPGATTPAPQDYSSEMGAPIVEPTDMDVLFSTRDTLNPDELIPQHQDDEELYGGLKPDPKLNQNFLQNSWSLGIEAVKNRKPGSYINDLRGARPNPIASFVWNNPTQFPELFNKTLGDVS